MNDTRLDEVEMYVVGVRAALADLPEEVVQELTEDLPQHLSEVLSEDGGPLADRLGSPLAYATELRVAAGADGTARAPRGERWAAHLAETRRRLDILDTRTGPLLGHERASEFLAQLRPAWWVLRGYLAALALAHLLDDSGQPQGLLPRIGGSEPVALVLTAVGVLASVWIGRRSAGLYGWQRRVLHASTVVLALFAVSVFADADVTARGAGYETVTYQDTPFSGVRDLYVYDAEGRLVEGARIFDQDGSPIDVDTGWCSGSTGEYEAAEHGTFPRCPLQAPFRLGRSAPAPSATPSVSPSVSPSAVPSPSG